MSSRNEASAQSPWKRAVDRHYEVFLEQLSEKGRATVQKHDELCEAEGTEGSGELWKRLAGGLSQLSGHATEILGRHSVKFHIPDGKYKQQVFALEDSNEGTLAVYFPDVLKPAIEQKILAAGTSENQYKVPGSDTPLQLVPIDAETRDMVVCKAMVGWGRRALRVDLNVAVDEKKVRAVEMMCELAAKKWAGAKGATS